MTDAERETRRLMSEAARTGRPSPWVRNAASGTLPYKVHADSARTTETLAAMLRRTMPRGDK